MSEAPRDQNHVTAALFESSTTPGLTIPGQIIEATGRIKVDAASGGTPGGANTDIQFNDSGAFGGADTFILTGSGTHEVRVSIGDTDFSGDMPVAYVATTLSNDQSSVYLANSNEGSNITLNAKDGLTALVMQDTAGPITTLNTTDLDFGGDGNIVAAGGGLAGDGHSISITPGNAAAGHKGGNIYLDPAVVDGAYAGFTIAGVNGHATTDTGGFLVIGNTAGVPTGVLTEAYTTGALTYDSTNNNLYVYNNTGTAWHQIGGGGSGDVVGPASATDNAVARFDGTTGKLIQNSAVTIADTSGDITAGKYNGLTVTASTGTLTIVNAKVATVSNTLTFTGTDGSSVAFGTGGTVLYANQSITLSGDVTGSGTTAITTTVAKIAGTTVSGTTGSGDVVFSTSPTLVTPVLGAATATSINGNILTAGSSTYTGTAAQTYTFPGATATIAGLASTQTMTNKRITRRTATANVPGATPSTNSDNVDYQVFTGLGTAITSMTTNLSGTPVAGDFLEFWLTDDGTARGITWGASFASTTVSLPTTTVLSTKLRVLFEWGGSTWDCVAVA